jgi:DNA polymerase III subunit delta
MQLNADQLPQHLKRGLAPVYFICGDDPLTALECADAIRVRAQTGGFDERKVHTVESGFDWDAFYADTRAGSLFASRRLIELRIPTGKPGEQGAGVLVELSTDPSPGILLLVVTGRLDKQARAAKWVTALERAGVSVTVYPIESRQLPAWIDRRMRARGLTPSPGVTDMLAHYTEGNSLACAQEIDKLALNGAHEVSVDDIEGNLGDNARFTVYALTDAALAGDTVATLRILKRLQGEGEAPALISWALVREVREFARMAQAIDSGRAQADVLDDFRVWARRKPIAQKALARHRLDAWHDLLCAAERLDRIVKGRTPADVWLELESLALAIGGCRTPAYEMGGDVR